MLFGFILLAREARPTIVHRAALTSASAAFKLTHYLK